ncbi:hypothetical protein EHV15_35640 [Paenibacillus oralis]|uniref:Uncharacterized protein n=1 Tax=Paenibacillus oralis TaxID=2490856 RepID=A0A3P3TA73_9BACL|nr:hypothetical protein [Paenibacillus oralis]RRJ54907.1 hypothetical protein EHV15_35640 [Paenibacillus oralis]
MENRKKVNPTPSVNCRNESNDSSSIYGVDLEKVELRYQELVANGDEKQMADYAQHVIPLLLKNARKTRLVFNSEAEEIARRCSAFGRIFTHWGDNVEELLDQMEIFLTRFMEVETKLVVVWERIEDWRPTGDFDLWIVTKQADGYVGSPITTPSLDSFLQDLYKFGEGKLPLQPIEFHWISRCNMVQKY